MFRLVLQRCTVQLQAGSSSGHGLLSVSAHNWQIPASVRNLASSRRSKKNSDLKGYDFILHQWKRTQATGSKHKPATPGAYGSPWFQDTVSSSSGKGRKGRSADRKRRSSQSPWKQTWSDADLAAAAAAAQLHPDEFHNLVFSSDDCHDNNSSSSQSRKERRKARQAKRRAKRVQQAAKQAWGYAEFNYEWSDNEDESDDEWQQPYYSSQRPDWQWWDEQQERQWFEQAWRQSTGQQGWQQRNGTQYKSERADSRSSSRPWWESFQQSYQRQQQQFHQQRTQQRYDQQQHHQQQQQNHHQQWSSGWQQARSPVQHPQSVLESLAMLGLPADSTLQRAALKAAFHRAAMQWHPDMHAGEHAKAAAEAKFKLVKEAYESLVSRAAA